MKYVFLLYNIEHEDHASPEAMAEWGVYETFLAERQAKVTGAALQPTATATTVSVRNGETLITDGPFADTKEHLGGFYILECANLDEAIEFARRNPWAPTGHIEIRPLVEYS